MRAGRTAAGFEFVADFEAVGLVAGLVFAELVFARLAVAFADVFVEPFVKLALTAVGFPVLVFSTGLADCFNGFPLSGADSDLVFLALGFDEFAFAFTDFAGLATTALAVFTALPLVPCF